MYVDWRYGYGGGGWFNVVKSIQIKVFTKYNFTVLQYFAWLAEQGGQGGHARPAAFRVTKKTSLESSQQKHTQDIGNTIHHCTMFWVRMPPDQLKWVCTFTARKITLSCLTPPVRIAPSALFCSWLYIYHVQHLCLLHTRDDYLRASRALLREIARALRHEIDFVALCRGFMQERAETQFKDLDGPLKVLWSWGFFTVKSCLYM